MDICNTYRPVIEWIAELVGGSVYSQEREQIHFRRRHHWCSKSSTHLLPILKGMLPYLKIKRGQAALAIEFFESVDAVKKHGDALSPKELDRREQLALALRASRWEEFSAIPKNNHGKSVCPCGVEFNKKSTTHKYCCQRCCKRYIQRRVRERKRLAEKAA